MPEDFALKMWDSRTELELAYEAIIGGRSNENKRPCSLNIDGYIRQ
jgi:hypothetical protein